MPPKKVVVPPPKEPSIHEEEDEDYEDDLEEEEVVSASQEKMGRFSFAGGFKKEDPITESVHSIPSKKEVERVIGKVDEEEDLKEKVI